MNSTIIFLSIFIIFLSLMLTIKIKIILDLNNNKLVIMIWIFKIKVLTINISIIGLYYQINNSKKFKSLHLILNQEEKYFIKQIKSSIIDKLYFDDIILVTELGLMSASDTAISIGILNMFCVNLANKLFAKNSDIRLYFNNTPDFEDMKLKIDLELKVYFTIFDLLFAIIMSVYKRGKYVKKRN